MSTKTRKNKRRRQPSGSPASSRRLSASAQEANLAARTRKVPRPRRRGLSGGAKTAIGIGVAVVALGVIFYLGQPHQGSGSGQYKFAVGTPGPGQQAPEIKLASTQGGTFDLSSMKGKTVALYFQEGLTCQPCWDQLKDIDSRMSEFTALGIDQVVSVTTDPIDQIKQKTSDMGITSPVLSDPNLSVSQAYGANSYGMMGTSRDGHSFIVVGPDSKILWRADYGGAPNFTMYVPVANLIADMRAGLHKQSP